MCTAEVDSENGITTKRPDPQDWSLKKNNSLPMFGIPLQWSESQRVETKEIMQFPVAGA